MQTIPIAVSDVEAWNDAFAVTHDIDEYYARSGMMIRWVERRRLACIRQMLAVRPGDRILEVGCGGGHVLRMFPNNELVGVDVSGRMIAKARRNLRGYNVELLKGELDELELPPASFERIICTEVLEHVVDPQRLLSELARVLAVDGKIVVTLPNDGLIERVKSAILRSRLTVLPPFRRISWGGDKYHLHAWLPGEMPAFLSDYFVVDRAKAVPNRYLPIRYCFECSSLPTADVIASGLSSALKSA
jgi:ubiquinone/menaquinone biosynthesis C-methylase UbiE